MSIHSMNAALSSTRYIHEQDLGGLKLSCTAVYANSELVCARTCHKRDCTYFLVKDNQCLICIFGTDADAMELCNDSWELYYNKGWYKDMCLFCNTVMIF